MLTRVTLLPLFPTNNLTALKLHLQPERNIYKYLCIYYVLILNIIHIPHNKFLTLQYYPFLRALMKLFRQNFTYVNC